MCSAFTAAVKTELSDGNRSLSTNGRIQHGGELPSRRSCPTETGAFQQMGAFSMGESGKAEAWTEGQVEVGDEDAKWKGRCWPK